jgi:hypothetical protein
MRGVHRSGGAHEREGSVVGNRVCPDILRGTLVEELIARGETHERALQLAQERFGNDEAARQECVAVNRARR